MLVIGAGFPRTGTTSLRAALERLLDGPCYHMAEVVARPEDVASWQRALDGEPEVLRGTLDGYRAAVDWPASAFWRDLTRTHPDALVVLSTRTDGEAWWRSFDGTVAWAARTDEPPAGRAWQRLFRGLLEREVGPGWDDHDRGVAAYERHCAAVRRHASADRLLEWSADQGWEPLCTALGVPVPDEPFPHLNTSAEWQQRHPRED